MTSSRPCWHQATLTDLNWRNDGSIIQEAIITRHSLCKEYSYQVLPLQCLKYGKSEQSTFDATMSDGKVTVEWKTFEGEDFRELVKITIFAEKTFTDCSVLPYQRTPHPKQNFAKKTFTNSHKTMKIHESFLPQKFPAIRYIRAVHVWMVTYLSATLNPLYCILTFVHVPLQRISWNKVVLIERTPCQSGVTLWHESYTNCSATNQVIWRYHYVNSHKRFSGH